MSNDLVNTLKSADFYSVVPFDAAKEKLVVLDFTENNTELSDDILLDTGKFSVYIKNKLAAANAKYGIGG